MRLPGGLELRGPSPGQISRALGIGRELAPEKRSISSSSAAAPQASARRSMGRPRVWRRSSSSTALGGQAGSSRRIENYLGFPAGISGSELTSRAVTQARKFNARTASPYRAVSLEQANGAYVVRLEEDHEIAARTVLLATGAQYRRPSVDRLADYEGMSVFYAAGPPEAQLCGASRVGVIGGGNSAGQAAVWRARRAGDAAASPRRPARDNVRLPRRATRALRRGCPRSQRSRHAAWRNGQLDAVTLKSGERLAFSFLFCFLGAPCTDWLGDVVARDENGFILTGAAAGADTLLETSLPGVFAAGDVRSGSTKRCASAVGEGAMAVQLVHGRVAEHRTAVSPRER